MVSRRRGDSAQATCPRLSNRGSNNATPAPFRNVRRCISACLRGLPNEIKFGSFISW